MWFWRRREIYVGNSLEEFNRIRNLLEAHHIRCDYKTDSHMKAEWDQRLISLERMGSNPAFATTYFLYVDRENYAFAENILHSAPRQK